VHVLVVDDEERLVRVVCEFLHAAGLTTTARFDGVSGLEAARAPYVDAIVLDLMLPRMSGTDVCRALRAEGNDVPILMLTARGTVKERVTGLEAGADDYLVKPFALEELGARLNAMTRRRAPEETSDRLIVGDVILDMGSRRVWIGAAECTLARREFAMLRALMERAGKVVTRAVLFDEVWSDEVDVNSNALEVHMSRLRSHLAASESARIVTLRGVGYRMELTGA
jgi:DNA-binding response OmpR family regulator